MVACSVSRKGGTQSCPVNLEKSVSLFKMIYYMRIKGDKEKLGMWIHNSFKRMDVNGE